MEKLFEKAFQNQIERQSTDFLPQQTKVQNQLLDQEVKLIHLLKKILKPQKPGLSHEEELFMSKSCKETSQLRISTHQNSLTSILIGTNSKSTKIKIDDKLEALIGKTILNDS